MSSYPISMPLRRETEETWKQVIGLFRKHGLSEPPIRLRDELVVAFEWAWYGVALQSAADTPAPQSRLEGKITALQEWSEQKYGQAFSISACHDLLNVLKNDGPVEQGDALRELVERAQAIISTSTYPNWHEAARAALASEGQPPAPQTREAGISPLSPFKAKEE